jgi:hypothetical protein
MIMPRRNDKMRLIKTKEEAKTSLVRNVTLPLSQSLYLDGETTQRMVHPLNLNLDLAGLTVLAEENLDIFNQKEFGVLLTKDEAKTDNEELLLWVKHSDKNHIKH